MRAPSGGPPHSEGGAAATHGHAPADSAAAARPLASSAPILGEPSDADRERLAHVIATLGLTEAEARQWLADTDAEIAEGERESDEEEAREAAFLAEIGPHPLDLVDRSPEALAALAEAGKAAGHPDASLAEQIADYAAHCEAREIPMDAGHLAELASWWTPEALAADAAHRLARVEEHLDVLRGGTPIGVEWLDEFRRRCFLAETHLDEVRKHYGDGFDDDERLARFVQTLLAGKTEDTVVERNAPLDWASVWENAHDEVQWLAEPLVEAGTSVALYSAPKVGKSLLVLDACAAMASGRSVLGKPADEPKRVLYLDAENTHRRPRRAADRHGLRARRLRRPAGLRVLS